MSHTRVSMRASAAALAAAVMTVGLWAGEGGAAVDNPACGPPWCEYWADSGTSNNAIGLNTGDVAWVQTFEAGSLDCNFIRCIRVEFGRVNEDAPNTTSLRLFVYEDPFDEGDPADAELIWSACDGPGCDVPSYVVRNEDTPVFNEYPVGPVEVFGRFFVVAAVDGMFPAAIDQTTPGPDSWIAYFLSNPHNPLDFPGELQLISEAIPGLDGTWMLRTVGDDVPWPCLGNTNGDFVIDVNDLNNVILDWGTDGSAHGGDISGALGPLPDGIVDVNDLNLVILSWGDCV